MRIEKIVKWQRILTYLSIFMGLVIFLYGLGFMTNIHVLFFDGDNDMYEFYKSVQVLNKTIFNIGVFYLLYGLSLLQFEIHKKAVNIVGYIWVLVFTVVTIVRSLTVFKYVPYFAKKYDGLEFSIIEGYKPTYWLFDLSTVLYIAWDILSLVMVLVCSISLAKYIKHRNELKEGVAHDSE